MPLYTDVTTKYKQESKLSKSAGAADTARRYYGIKNVELALHTYTIEVCIALKPHVLVPCVVGPEKAVVRHLIME